MALLLDKISADATSEIVRSSGGYVNIFVRSGDSTTPELGGGAVTIEAATVDDDLERFRVLENGTFITDDTKTGIYLQAGIRLRAKLTGSTSPVNVTVDMLGNVEFE